MISIRAGSPPTTPTKSTTQEKMLWMLQDQPDDSPCDELLREPAFTRIGERGLADPDGGRTVRR